MPRTRTTLSIDNDVLRAARIAAARGGKRDSELVEDALRAYLGLAVIDRIRAKSALASGEAEELAYSEIHASRTD
jgi:Arc/MetJ family transcription regulator